MASGNERKKLQSDSSALQKVALVAGGPVADVYTVSEAIYTEDGKTNTKCAGKRTAKAKAPAVADTAGGGTGAYVGAAVGSLFGGVGAVPGAVIGGAIGSMIGSVGGSTAAKAVVDGVASSISEEIVKTRRSREEKIKKPVTGRQEVSRSLSLHEKFQCPFKVLSGVSCAWTGRLSTIAAHLRIDHVCETSDNKEPFAVKLQNFSNSTNFHKAMLMSGDLFYLLWFRKEDTVYFLVYVICEENCVEYTYDFKINNNQREMSVTGGTCRHFSNHASNLWDKGDIVRLHCSTVQKYLDGNGDLSCVIQIRKHMEASSCGLASGMRAMTASPPQSCTDQPTGGQEIFLREGEDEDASESEIDNVYDFVIELSDHKEVEYPLVESKPWRQVVGVN